MSLKICFVTAELAPLAKAGGLADVSGALLKSLLARGHDVRLFMPAYGSIDLTKLDAQPVGALQNLPVTIGGQDVSFSVLSVRVPNSTARAYLVDCPQYFHRAGIYGNAADEHRRFLLLTHAAFISCQHLSFAPDILHCNDWHTAAGPLWLRTLYQWDGLFERTRSVLTIHNIGYQGVFAPTIADDLLPPHMHSALHQDYLRAGQINLLRLGLVYADMITTVSPTYAREIMTPQYGHGMESTLSSRLNVVGILNGVDYDEWDPRHDRYLPLHYGANKLGTKAKLKELLLERVGLEPAAAARRPLIGMVTRLAEQKGIDLLFDALPATLAERDFNLVVLGAGESRYEHFFQELQQQYPARVKHARGYSEELSHWIEAGSDMFLMPSRYEPCGLNQLYSLRYGTVPIVRRTGGLADSVEHFDFVTGTGTGIVFNDYDADGVRWALNTAMDLYQQKSHWRRLVQNGMAKDFSWQHQVGEYERVYQQLVDSAGPRA
jgi:starch synthase